MIAHLTDTAGDVPPTKIELARERVVLNRGTGMEGCFEALDGLPTYIVPRRNFGSEVQRLGQLADALSHSNLKAGAGSEGREKLVDALDAEYSKRKATPPYTAVIKESGTIPVNAVLLEYGTDKFQKGEIRQVPVSDEMVGELYEWARKRLGLDLGLRYWKRRTKTPTPESHWIIKLQLYALANDGQVTSVLEKTAGALVSLWLNEFKQEIKKLPESERARFDEVKRRSNKPTLDVLDFKNRLTLDWSRPVGATNWQRHLYQSSDSAFPEKLNTWETAALNEEMAHPDFAGWLRNKDNQPWALCVPYEFAGGWKSCFPDFIFFRRTKTGDVVASIIDPHLTSLEDAPHKAAALAKFADAHQERFDRIDLIIVDKQGTPDERVRRLRLMDEKTRKKVMGVTSNQHLKDLFDYQD